MEISRRSLFQTFLAACGLSSLVSAKQPLQKWRIDKPDGTIVCWVKCASTKLLVGKQVVMDGKIVYEPLPTPYPKYINLENAMDWEQRFDFTVPNGTYVYGFKNAPKITFNFGDKTVGAVGAVACITSSDTKVWVHSKKDS